MANHSALFHFGYEYYLKIDVPTFLWYFLQQNKTGTISNQPTSSTGITANVTYLTGSKGSE